MRLFYFDLSTLYFVQFIIKNNKCSTFLY